MSSWCRQSGRWRCVPPGATCCRRKSRPRRAPPRPGEWSGQERQGCGACGTRTGLVVSDSRPYTLGRMTENAFEAIKGNSDSRLLLLCDHASNALPEGMLGLDPGLLDTHIAHDIGAAAVTRALAAAYGAPAFLGGWSRLLIDLNRGADDPTIVMKLSDGSIIPGNVLGDRQAEAAEVARRIAVFHAPYHA